MRFCWPVFCCWPVCFDGLRCGSVFVFEGVWVGLVRGGVVVVVVGAGAGVLFVMRLLVFGWLVVLCLLL